MASSGGLGSWRHLALRFFGALSPAGPAAADESWALGHMGDGEQALWRRMSGPDRRHAVGVAHDTVALLEANPPRSDVVVAALFHDVGKVESSFGTFTRVAVTVAALVVGRTRLERWGTTATTTHSYRARVGLYLTHDRLGAELLERAGSEPLVVSWAREHHRPSEQWTVDATVAAALKAADGD